MKWRIYLISSLAITLFTWFIQPLPAPFYGMKLPFKVIWILIFYLYPFILFPVLSIPFSFIAHLISKKINSFGPTYTKTVKVVSIIGFCLIIVFEVIKLTLGKNPYPNPEYYSEQSCTEKDTSPLKQGEFFARNRKLIRSKNKQIEIETDGDTITYEIQWINDCEYLLIRDNQDWAMQDSTFYKITDISENRYTVYANFSGYGEKLFVDIK